MNNIIIFCNKRKKRLSDIKECRDCREYEYQTIRECQNKYIYIDNKNNNNNGDNK